MPSLSARPNINITTHSSASDFLSVASEALSLAEEQSNVVLALALKTREKEQQMQPGIASSARNLWVCVWTTKTSSRSTTVKSSLDFVFALNDNPFGGYPLFIWSGYPSCDLTPAFVEHRIQLAAMGLYKSVPSQRIFSVFGLVPVVRAFQNIWAHISGHNPEPIPFYSAKLSYCTKLTLQPASSRLPQGDSLRAAEVNDLEQVAALCHGFAQDSVHFPLEDKESSMQAFELIREKQVWVYQTCDAYGRPRIASIVCSSRSSPNVTSITKVYTDPEFRGRQFAKHLVYWVTQNFLYNESKEAVVLYVSHGNPAEKVYHRIGYAGLCGEPRPTMVEDWLEVGFQDTTRGHW
ncbi:GNAT family acetyltransferase [Rhizoctonia solani 123E]|uniref:GNAT family acetyltransferase n=1 Tax=Rhizoctonia solani 123E TaxID=1423351 RepID=A0A074SJY1_9AGAM|nr:GNAT family acetyltransferase [Rhizoctonia solani 123E]